MSPIVFVGPWAGARKETRSPRSIYFLGGLWLSAAKNFPSHIHKQNNEVRSYCHLGSLCSLLGCFVCGYEKEKKKHPRTGPRLFPSFPFFGLLFLLRLFLFRCGFFLSVVFCFALGAYKKQQNTRPSKLQAPLSPDWVSLGRVGACNLCFPRKRKSKFTQRTRVSWMFGCLTWLLQQHPPNKSQRQQQTKNNHNQQKTQKKNQNHNFAHVWLRHVRY